MGGATRRGSERQDRHVVAQVALGSGEHGRLHAIGDRVGRKAAAAGEQVGQLAWPKISRRRRRTSVTPSV